MRDVVEHEAEEAERHVGGASEYVEEGVDVAEEEREDEADTEDWGREGGGKHDYVAESERE
jgi:hypothetical protein